MKLGDFAKTQRQHHTGHCWLCGIPQRQEVDDARTAGVPRSTIVRWLVEDQGLTDATGAKLDHHFKHHQR